MSADKITAVEEQMGLLEERLKKMELSGNKQASGDSDSSAAVEKALQTYKVQMLTKLKAIRDQIANEGGDVAVVRKERDAALVENAKMKVEIERMNYRINHLVRALSEEEAKNAK